MSKNAVSSGHTFTAVAPVGGVLSGVPFLLGILLVVPVFSAAAGASVSVETEGVFEVAKLSTDVVAQGVALYWDDTNKRLTTTASGNTLSGVAESPAGNGETTVRIKLKGR